MIQAIETAYNGYRFRSRLEARWAVFFDALGVRYEYELEGFYLGGSGNYLPDFRLPDCHLWVEIKPVAPSDLELQKVRDLAIGSEELAAICIGTPDIARSHYMVIPYQSSKDRAGRELGAGFTVYKGLKWSECLYCNSIGLTQSNDQNHLSCSDVCMGGEYRPNHSSHSTKRLIDGYNASRSARFEYGETPQVIERVIYKTVEQDSLVWRGIDIIVRDKADDADFTQPFVMIEGYGLAPWKGIHLNDGGVPLCTPLSPDPTKGFGAGGFNLDKWAPRRADVLVSNICKRCVKYSLARAKRKR